MLESYSQDKLRDLVGHEVTASDGEKVGYVDLAFVDDETGRPEWLGVWNGYPGGTRHLVPIQGVAHDDGEIRLPWTKEHVEGAPAYNEEDERGLFDDEPSFGISQEKEDRAYAHYGLERPSVGRAEGARLRVWVVEERAVHIVG
ncbi:MAG TPA: PRC-barrel domain-containing protein [Gaiellaceae bacterium]|jgi:hypothetical protein